MLWYFLVTVKGVGWYGVDSFPRFGCLTSTPSPTWMSQSLTALLASVWLLILRFWWASIPRMVTGSRLFPLRTGTGPLSNFTTWGMPCAVELGNHRFGRSRVFDSNLRKSWVVINYNKDIVSSNLAAVNAYLFPRTIEQTSHLQRFKGRLERGNLIRNTTFHYRIS